MVKVHEDGRRGIISSDYDLRRLKIVRDKINTAYSYARMADKSGICRKTMHDIMGHDLIPTISVLEALEKAIEKLSNTYPECNIQKKWRR
jgi:hypothetical protein